MRKFCDFVAVVTGLRILVSGGCCCHCCFSNFILSLFGVNMVWQLFVCFRFFILIHDFISAVAVVCIVFGSIVHVGHWATIGHMSAQCVEYMLIVL